jgi:hypothetical protein
VVAKGMLLSVRIADGKPYSRNSRSRPDARPGLWSRVVVARRETSAGQGSLDGVVVAGTTPGCWHRAAQINSAISSDIRCGH